MRNLNVEDRRKKRIANKLSPDSPKETMRRRKSGNGSNIVSYGIASA